MTYREEFITFMVRSGVLTFGDFTTKSGRKTPYFVNTGNYKTGAQAAKLGDYYAACIQEHMPDGITCLFGPASWRSSSRVEHSRVPRSIRSTETNRALIFTSATCLNSSISTLDQGHFEEKTGCFTAAGKFWRCMGAAA